MADLVTIQRVHLETLMRRTQLTLDDLNNGKLSSEVLVDQVELETLQTTARKYENLRHNLLRGNVSNATIDLLSQDDATLHQQTSATPPKQSRSGTGGVDLNASAARAPSSGFYDQLSSNTHRNFSLSAGTGGGWADADEDDEGDENEEDLGIRSDRTAGGLDGANHPEPEGPRLERQSTRTVQLTNLAEGTTHYDIIKAVRGGQLLDVFIRTHERTASISFVHASDARAFFDHVRRHDLYIKTKRLDIRWGERQFILPGNISSAIIRGASRNLIIRGCDSRHTEQSIRDDLEHIHNLVIVKLGFTGKDCHLSLNSIHNAVYARTCMMSRFKYKSTRFEWDLDECAQSYERLVPPKPPRQEVSAQRKVPSISNRFDLLRVNGDEEDENIPNLQSKITVGVTA